MPQFAPHCRLSVYGFATVLEGTNARSQVRLFQSLHFVDSFVMEHRGGRWWYYRIRRNTHRNGGEERNSVGYNNITFIITLPLLAEDNSICRRVSKLEWKHLIRWRRTEKQYNSNKEHNPVNVVRTAEHSQLQQQHPSKVERSWGISLYIISFSRASSFLFS